MTAKDVLQVGGVQFNLCTSFTSFVLSFLVSYAGERPWWPIQCLIKGRKKKANG